MESQKQKNKEEAIRAKKLALERMEFRDFTSAQKFATKAKQLCSDLENIEQIMAVCNVHSSSGDFYKILNADPAADMAAIKRQYGRMVLCLHPDKNKCPGAAEAFQMVAEAKAVLSDVDRRSFYDFNRRVVASENFGFSRFKDGENFKFGRGNCKEKNDEVVVVPAAVKTCFTDGKKGKRAAKSAPKAKGKENGKRVKASSKNLECSIGENKGFEKLERSKTIFTTIEPNSKILEYSDGVYNDFEKLERSKKLLTAEQIWAIYDTLGAMPRFYALVNNVVSDDFKVNITWLEPMPSYEKENEWLYLGLPCSFGKFKLGHSETIEDHAIFSNLVTNWKKSGDLSNVVYEIYPRKGETWALFKKLNFDWLKDPEKHSACDFEVVEISTDYDGEFGVTVSYLGKMMGKTKNLYSSFGRSKGKDWEVIKAKERFRFSHKIPSFAVTLLEGSNCVEKFYELDPAAMPSS